jgi:2-dehydropantoate 2-reductase
VRYVVYGAGAVGGVIAGHLHAAGREVVLVARGEHLARIRQRGLVVDSHAERYVVDAPAADGAAGLEWTDNTVVLLCVKAQHTAAALDDLVAHAPPDASVVSAQNGVSNERAILRLFEHAYAITVMLPASHLEPGVVVQKCHPTPGILDIGRVPSGVDPLCDSLAADFRAAGFESVPRPDIMAWKHRKLLMNLGNGIDALCPPSAAADDLEDRARSEGEAVLVAAGVPLVSAEADLARRGDILRPRPTGQPPRGGSTWQSISRASGSVEIDHLAGEIVLLGRLHGVPTPVNALIQRATHELLRSGGAPRSLAAEDLLAQLDRARFP